ncbi:MAG: hypothetical protein PSV46_19280 [Reyranella sp.]|nr:hypothetical protein [Reyranella sp.]
MSALKLKQPDGTQIIGDRTLDEWITWAEECVTRGDPTLGPIDPIFEAVAEMTS